MGPLTKMSPRSKARVAGLLYLIIFISAPSGAASATRMAMFINLAADTGVAILFYYLFKPVDIRLSFAASLVRVIFVIVMAVNSLNYFGVMEFLQISRSAVAFNRGYGVALIPFGLHCALTGYLIIKSTFLPRTLGALMMLAGLAYLIFLYPSLGERLFIPYIVVPAVVAEGALTLWLLVMGVNNSRWLEQNERAFHQGMR